MHLPAGYVKGERALAVKGLRLKKKACCTPWQVPKLATFSTPIGDDWS